MPAMGESVLYRQLHQLCTWRAHALYTLDRAGVYYVLLVGRLKPRKPWLNPMKTTVWRVW